MNRSSIHHQGLTSFLVFEINGMAYQSKPYIQLRAYLSFNTVIL